MSLELYAIHELAFGARKLNRGELSSGRRLPEAGRIIVQQIRRRVTGARRSRRPEQRRQNRPGHARRREPGYRRRARRIDRDRRLRRCRQPRIACGQPQYINSRRRKRRGRGSLIRVCKRRRPRAAQLAPANTQSRAGRQSVIGSRTIQDGRRWKRDRLVRPGADYGRRVRRQHGYCHSRAGRVLGVACSQLKNVGSRSRKRRRGPRLIRSAESDRSRPAHLRPRDDQGRTWRQPVIDCCPV